jgi:hypothetical protein
MLGKALYYPHIDIRDPRWLRSAILFWDEIQSIVPPSISEPYHTHDTQICEQEGFLRGLRCDLRPDLLRKLGQRVIALMEQPRWLSELYRTNNPADPTVKAIKESENFGAGVRRDLRFAGIYPEKMTPELRDFLVQFGFGYLHRGHSPEDLREVLDEYPHLGRLHPEKLSYQLQRRFGIRAEHEGDWLLVDGRFADAYMAALASLLATENNLSPLTPEDRCQGMNVRCLVDDIAAASPSTARGAILTLVMSGLNIDPETSIRKLISFRRSHAMQLAELGGHFDDLKTQIQESESKKELDEKAKWIYANKILPGMTKLRDELDGQTIKSIIKGVACMATISIAKDSPFVQHSDLSPGLLLGAGAFLTVAGLVVNRYLAGKKAKAASPYSYLFDAQRKFSLPQYL